MELETLVLADSTYLDAASHAPFTGRVFRRFPDDSTRIQLRGTLVDGTWEGPLEVYHANGRIRYSGALHAGAKCGEWIENRDEEPPDDIYASLMQEIESLGMYPPCPDSG